MTESLQFLAVPPRRTSRRWMTLVPALTFGAMLTYLLWVALRLSVDLWDSFQSLMNGRSIAWGLRVYSLNRAPLMPALYALIEIATRHIHADLIAFRASHVLAVLFYALLCLCTYKLLRLHLSPAMALTGAMGLAFNGLLIHYAPMFKEDILGSLLITAAFYFYLRAANEARASDLLLCGLLAGLAGATKYSHLPLVLAIIGIYEIVSRRLWRTSKWAVAAHALILLLLPVIVVLLLASVDYWRVGRSSFWGAPQQFLLDFLGQGRSQEEAAGFLPESPLLGYTFVFWSLSPPVAFCVLLGIVVAWKTRRAGFQFYLIWAGTIFLVHTYAFPLKESRFYFSIYPPLFYFAAHGAWALVAAIATRVPDGRRRIAAVSVVTAGLVAYPAINAAAECWRFTDPIYTVNFERQVSEAASRMAGSHRIFWIGAYYPVHPRDYVFHRSDKFTSLYHFWIHVVLYYVPNQGGFLNDASGPNAIAVTFTDPNAFRAVQNGDVFIVNTEPRSYQTIDLPPVLKPLLIARVGGCSLKPNDVIGGAVVFRSNTPVDSSSPTIEVRREGDAYNLRGTGVPASWVALCINPGEAGARTGYARVGPDGRFRAAVSASPVGPGRELKSIALRWLERPEAFSLPVRERR